MYMNRIKPLILTGDVTMSNSSFKVKCQLDIIVKSVELGTWYLIMHVHLMKSHILRDDVSRSRSPSRSEV